jgi:transposase-like protein
MAARTDPTRRSQMDKGEQKRKLSVKQRLAVTLMAQGKLQIHVAKEIGIDPTTLSQWKHQIPEFADALEEALRSHEEAALASMRQAIVPAMNTVHELLTCGNENVRLGAANSIFGNWERLVKNMRIEDQIAMMEQRLALMRDAADQALEPPAAAGEP